MFMIPKIFGEKTHEQTQPEDLWTVFLIDDDKDDQKLAEQILKKSDLIGEIICISDSTSLFDQLARQSYLHSADQPRKVLIILDIHMPGVDGLTLLEQLKSNPYTFDFPIIMVTGDQEPAKIYESYRKDASSFINKPITSAHLENIHSILEYGDRRQRAARFF